MLLEIKPNNRKPIYEQLILEIKRGIVTKELSPGEGMPGVRVLASDLGINMHTVNKVYKHLEEEGLLVKESYGFAVNPKAPKNKNPERKEAFDTLLYELVLEKELYNISDEELKAKISALQNELHQKAKNEKGGEQNVTV